MGWCFGWEEEGGGLVPCWVGWRGWCGQSPWDASPDQLHPWSPPDPWLSATACPARFAVRGVFAEGEEEVVKPLMKLPLLAAVLHRALPAPSRAVPCCPVPALALRPPGSWLWSIFVGWTLRYAVFWCIFLGCKGNMLSLRHLMHL